MSEERSPGAEMRFQEAQKELGGITRDSAIRDFFAGREHWGNYVTKHPEENRGQALELRQAAPPVTLSNRLPYIPPHLKRPVSRSPESSPLGRSQAPSPPKSNSYMRRHRLGRYRPRVPSRSPPRYSRRRSPSRSPPRYSRRRSPSRSPSRSPRWYSRRQGPRRSHSRSHSRSPSRSPPRYSRRSPRSQSPRRPPPKMRFYDHRLKRFVTPPPSPE